MSDETSDIADQLAAMARELERVGRNVVTGDTALSDRINATVGLVDQLGERADKTDETLKEADGHIRALAQLVTKMAGPNPATPVSWLLLGPAQSDGDGDGPPPAHISLEEATKLLETLTRWVSDVYLRFDDAELPSCWMWHPDVIEELVWLHGLHRDVYAGKGAAWSKVADWHDRFRLGVVRRVQNYLRDGCDLTRHHWGSGDKSDRGVPAVPLAAHLGTVARVWSDDRVTPAPDAVQSADATAYDRRQAARSPRY